MKDWNGNSNSLRAAIVTKKPNSNNVREPDDFYATDPKALDILLDKCSIELRNMLELLRDFNVWEPACGDGNLAECLKQHGFHVVASDLKDRGYGFTGIDFLKTTNQGCCFDIVTHKSYLAGTIITNPPYKLATEFIEHALDILPPCGLYIALMNINYLSGIDRYKRVYSNGYLWQVYIFSKRIECWKNNIPSGHSSIANYAWYVFQKCYNGQPTLYWL